MKLDVIGFGALNFDKLCKVERIAKSGEHIAIDSIYESPGGSAANTIVALAKLNLKTGFIGAIGDDNEGKEIFIDLKKFHVDTKGIKILKGKKTGTIIGFVDKKGERTLYPYAGANNFLMRKHLSINYAKNAKFLHLSSFVGEKQFELQKFLVEKIHNDVRITFSPGDLYSKKGLKKILPIVKHSEVIFLNKNETEILTKKSYFNGAKILSEYVKIVVITLGKKGCYIKTKENEFYIPAIKARVVDTTGAGDAFAAGFLYGLIKEMPLEICGKIGNFLASLCVEKFGAREWLKKKKLKKRRGFAPFSFRLIHD
ncbi:MAG: carbohydrate kinase family protein [Candidatus Altiarchaeota archaeon]